MKIKLIAPYDTEDTICSSGGTFKVQRLNLPLLAAYTPPGNEVEIIDEAFAPDDIDDDADLVGITVMTDLAMRAYQIADVYRQRGVKVVMGGIHPTVRPREALEHADSIVQGEGEYIWPQVVLDAAGGKMRKIYSTKQNIKLPGRPTPRYDLYPHLEQKSYTPIPVSIEASRGCPYHCEFCSVGHTMGHRYRLRPIRDVIDEIERLDNRQLFFCDDNFAMDRKTAKELFRQMIPLKTRWVSQGGVSLAEDQELLYLMKKAGCEGLLIGFESMSSEIQNEMIKLKKLKVDYGEAMRRFHREGISILGAFIFGFDHENKNIFTETLDFINKYRIDVLAVRAIVPFPGTLIYQRYIKEKRLTMDAWWLRQLPQDTVLFRPKSMSPDELAEGLEYVKNRTYTMGSVINRFFGITPWKRTFLGYQIYIGTNLANRKRFRKNGHV